MEVPCWVGCGRGVAGGGVAFAVGGSGLVGKDETCAAWLRRSARLARRLLSGVLTMVSSPCEGDVAECCVCGAKRATSQW